MIITCPSNSILAYQNIPIQFNWTVNDPDSNDNNGHIWLLIESINGSFYFEITTTPSFIQIEGDISGNKLRIILMFLSQLRFQI